ncbi:MAG TPA: type II toxin-antitoxin system VapC family toxin [Clostridia bacterium]|nr:type II toxin-antitoxin system VapC family toxin [Clostridia bacterium]
MKFDDLRPGSSVFIDANIFVYHFSGASSDCTTLLERCASAQLAGLTTTHIVLEVAHRLMLIEAVIKGIVSPGDVVKKLAAKPEAVAKLTEYSQHVRAISEMGVIVLPVTFELWLAGTTYQQRYGLLTNDSVLVAACLENGCPNLASYDTAFSRVKEIQLYEPTDIA